MSWITLCFYILGGLAIFGATSMLLSRHPMRCAVSLLFVMVILAILYALLYAPFIAVLHLIIYGGAIMIFIVFTISLMETKGDDVRQAFSQSVFLAVPSTVLFFFIVIYMVSTPAVDGKVSNYFENMKAVSIELFSHYLLHFEIASLILLVGIIGISALRGKKD